MLLRKRHHNLQGKGQIWSFLAIMKIKIAIPSLRIIVMKLFFQSEPSLCRRLHKDTGLPAGKISLAFIVICLEGKQDRVLTLSLNSAGKKKS